MKKKARTKARQTSKAVGTFLTIALPVGVLATTSCGPKKSEDQLKQLREDLKKIVSVGLGERQFKNVDIPEETNLTPEIIDQLGLDKLPDLLSSGVKVKVKKPLGSILISYVLEKDGKIFEFDVKIKQFDTSEEEKLLTPVYDAITKHPITSKVKEDFEKLLLGTRTIDSVEGLKTLKQDAGIDLVGTFEWIKGLKIDFIKTGKGSNVQYVLHYKNYAEKIDVNISEYASIEQTIENFKKYVETIKYSQLSKDDFKNAEFSGDYKLLKNDISAWIPENSGLKISLINPAYYHIQLTAEKAKDSFDVTYTLNRDDITTTFTVTFTTFLEDITKITVITDKVIGQKLYSTLPREEFQRKVIHPEDLAQAKTDLSLGVDTKPVDEQQEVIVKVEKLEDSLDLKYSFSIKDYTKDEIVTYKVFKEEIDNLDKIKDYFEKNTISAIEETKFKDTEIAVNPYFQGYAPEYNRDFKSLGLDYPSVKGYKVAVWKDKGSTEVTYRICTNAYLTPESLEDTTNKEYRAEEFKVDIAYFKDDYDKLQSVKSALEKIKISNLKELDFRKKTISAGTNITDLKAALDLDVDAAGIQNNLGNVTLTAKKDIGSTITYRLQLVKDKDHTIDITFLSDVDTFKEDLDDVEKVGQLLKSYPITSLDEAAFNSLEVSSQSTILNSEAKLHLPFSQITNLDVTVKYTKKANSKEINYEVGLKSKKTTFSVEIKLFGQDNIDKLEKVEQEIQKMKITSLSRSDFYSIHIDKFTPLLNAQNTLNYYSESPLLKNQEEWKQDFDIKVKKLDDTTIDFQYTYKTFTNELSVKVDTYMEELNAMETAKAELEKLKTSQLTQFSFVNNYHISDVPNDVTALKPYEFLPDPRNHKLKIIYDQSWFDNLASLVDSISIVHKDVGTSDVVFEIHIKSLVAEKVVKITTFNNDVIYADSMLDSILQTQTITSEKEYDFKKIALDKWTLYDPKDLGLSKIKLVPDNEGNIPTDVKIYVWKRAGSTNLHFKVEKADYSTEGAVEIEKFQSTYLKFYDTISALRKMTVTKMTDSDFFSGEFNTLDELQLDVNVLFQGASFVTITVSKPRNYYNVNYTLKYSDPDKKYEDETYELTITFDTFKEQLDKIKAVKDKIKWYTLPAVDNFQSLEIPAFSKYNNETLGIQYENPDPEVKIFMEKAKNSSKVKYSIQAGSKTEEIYVTMLSKEERTEYADIIDRLKTMIASNLLELNFQDLEIKDANDPEGIDFNTAKTQIDYYKDILTNHIPNGKTIKVSKEKNSNVVTYTLLGGTKKITFNILFDIFSQDIQRFNNTVKLFKNTKVSLIEKQKFLDTEIKEYTQYVDKYGNELLKKLDLWFEPGQSDVLEFVGGYVKKDAGSKTLYIKVKLKELVEEFTQDISYYNEDYEQYIDLIGGLTEKWGTTLSESAFKSKVITEKVLETTDLNTLGIDNVQDILNNLNNLNWDKTKFEVKISKEADKEQIILKYTCKFFPNEQSSKTVTFVKTPKYFKEDIDNVENVIKQLEEKMIFATRKYKQDWMDWESGTLEKPKYFNYFYLRAGGYYPGQLTPTSDSYIDWGDVAFAGLSYPSTTAEVGFVKNKDENSIQFFIKHKGIERKTEKIQIEAYKEDYLDLKHFVDENLKANLKTSLSQTDFENLEIADWTDFDASTLGITKAITLPDNITVQMKKAKGSKTVQYKVKGKSGLMYKVKNEKDKHYYFVPTIDVEFTEFA